MIEAYANNFTLPVAPPQNGDGTGNEVEMWSAPFFDCTLQKYRATVLTTDNSVEPLDIFDFIGYIQHYQWIYILLYLLNHVQALMIPQLAPTMSLVIPLVSGANSFVAANAWCVEVTITNVGQTVYQPYGKSGIDYFGFVTENYDSGSNGEVHELHFTQTRIKLVQA
jgi:hypothetical protein